MNKPHFRYIHKGGFWALYRSREAFVPMITGKCVGAMYKQWSMYYA